MLYGIQITKSVILNKIATEIDENIKQAKIEMRLCHHLAFNANGEEKDTTIHYGAMPVRLPEDPDHPGMHEKDLRLVVVRGFGQCAMLTLTRIRNLAALVRKQTSLYA